MSVIAHIIHNTSICGKADVKKNDAVLATCTDMDTCTLKQKRQVSKKPFSILKLDYGDVVQLCKYTKNHLTVYFNWVNSWY